jgi:16S rRNA processing protein RimM
LSGLRVTDPMPNNCDILLGRITKVSGYEGAVTVRLERLFSGNLPHIESVFLEIEGRPVPFFISATEYSGADILKLKFEDYESSEKVSEFVGCRVFLTEGKQGENKIDDIESLTGYQVLTQDNNSIGTIKEVIPNPGQWLLNVTSKARKSILIPFHEDFIVSIDPEKKILIMDIPDGLTDLN